jgi:isopentenyl-diphosphate delta-isomerase
MQQVILVNERDEEIGLMEKMEAHEKALLHRAFSIFLFNGNGEMLLQQRAASKYHSPLLWTNACCSHPMPGETIEAAAKRRLQEELGFETTLTKAFHFTYKAAFENGLTEHEFDHVLVGVYEGEMKLNTEEVQSIKYLSASALMSELQQQPNNYTEWFKIAFPLLQDWLKENKLNEAAA